MNTRLLLTLLIIHYSLFTIHCHAQDNLVSNVKFHSIGPSIMSGRVVDVDVCPDDPTHFYVAYASGGLWVTYNNGQSFEPLFDHEAVMTIGDIAVDWNHGETIWIGTGENNSSRSSYAGLGMYKSTDKGKTWQHKGLEDSHHIGRVLIDANDSNTLYVAVIGHLFTPNDERGVFKSIDGGNTWKKTLFVDNNTGAIDFVMDPSNKNILYAAMWHRERKPWNLKESGASSGIYKSIDAGETWSLITTKESGFPTGEGVGRIGLSIFAGDMGQVINPSKANDKDDDNAKPKHLMTKFVPRPIYAVVDNHDLREKKKDDKKKGLTKDTLRTMYKESFLLLKDSLIEKYLKDNDFDEEYSVERVKNMIRTDSIKPAALVEYLEDANAQLFDTEIKGAEVYRSDDAGKTWKKTHEGYLDHVFNTYGYYFGQIRVSPFNPNKIYIYGVPFLKSEDGGKTFKSIDAANTHGDYHALWLNPNRDGHIIVGNDGGVNISYDDGKSYFKANTPAVGQFYSVNVDMEKPYNVYGGLQDNGVWYGPSTNKESTGWHEEGEYAFKRIMGGDGMQVAIDTRDNTTVYTGYQFGNYFRVNRNTGENKYITPKHKLGERPLRWNWQAPIWLSKHNQDIVYFGSNKFHRAMNKGTDFQTLTSDLTNGGIKGNVPYGTITTITESPLMFGLLYLGTDDGNIYLSNNIGYDWHEISENLPQKLYYSRVIASAFDTELVYCSLNGKIFDDFKSYLFKHKSFRGDWDRIGTDLPAEPINVVREDPKNKNILYVGTDHGVYVSLNKGKNFMKMTGDFPNVAVHDLVIHPRDNDLVVGTHGRSIYIAHVGELQQLNDTLMAKDIYVFKIDPIKYNKNLGKRNNLWSEPHEIKKQFAFYVKEKGISTLHIKTDKDLLLKEIKDTSAAGLNYVNYDLSIDSTNLSKYQLWVNDNKKLSDDDKKIERADNKKYYLKPGKYFLEIETQKGIKSKQEFIIKSNEKKEAHGELPEALDKD